MSTAEVRWITGGAAAFCGLAALSSIGPTGEAIATSIVLIVLGAGAVGCLVGYRMHLLRIRRDIEAREARGEGLLRRVELPPEPQTARRPVCPASRRGRGPRRPVVRCGRGRRRYR